MCLEEERVAESTPGWPISKKERKAPVSSTNEGWGSREEGSLFCLLSLSFFLSPFLPPCVSLSLSLSVCQLSVYRAPSKTHTEYRIRITRLEALGFNSRVCVCLRVCLCAYVHASMLCVRMCVWVRLVCGAEMSLPVWRQTCLWLGPISQ